jgi:uncharacterized membrane protein
MEKVKKTTKTTKTAMIESVVLQQQKQIETLFSMIFNFLEKSDKDFQKIIGESERIEVLGFKRYN